MTINPVTIAGCCAGLCSWATVALVATTVTRDPTRAIEQILVVKLHEILPKRSVTTAATLWFLAEFSSNCAVAIGVIPFLPKICDVVPFRRRNCPGYMAMPFHGDRGCLSDQIEIHVTCLCNVGNQARGWLHRAAPPLQVLRWSPVGVLIIVQQRTKVPKAKVDAAKWMILDRMPQIDITDLLAEVNT